MSELHPKHEITSQVESHEDRDHGQRPEQAARHEDRAGKAEHQSRLAEHARHQVEYHARRSSELQHTPEAETHPSRQSLHRITADLRSLAYERTVSRIRRRLNPAEKVLDSVVRQPGIEELGDAGSKTVARPWPLLGAGITALVGYAIALYYAKHYGFAVKPSLMLVLFFAGYCITLVVELITRIIMKSKGVDQ